jgi:octaprenyl-diphosphate synthase
MLSLSQIQAPIEEDMRFFENHFRKSMKSNVALLDKITHYIIKRKGKQMRPMFVFLSARLFENTSDSRFTAASLIELLHTATLVHDDVVDDANMRRGFFSINALWKNKIAVLVGDFLLSRGLILSVEKNEFSLLKIVTKAVEEMSEGELLQMEKARKLDITEELYYEIIRQKTASLIAACCASGAASSGADEDTIEKMRLFGEYTGIAFQIKDDLFDYGEGEDIGKPTGIDIQERKMTLPLIYALNNATKQEKRKIINIIKNHNEDSIKVKEVIQFVVEKGGIDYAVQEMKAYRGKALEILQQLPQNEANKSLEGLVIFATERRK